MKWVRVKFWKFWCWVIIPHPKLKHERKNLFHSFSRCVQLLTQSLNNFHPIMKILPLSLETPRSQIIITIFRPTSDIICFSHFFFFFFYQTSLELWMSLRRWWHWHNFWWTYPEWKLCCPLLLYSITYSISRRIDVYMLLSSSQHLT